MLSKIEIIKSYDLRKKDTLILSLNLHFISEVLIIVGSLSCLTIHLYTYCRHRSPRTRIGLEYVRVCGGHSLVIAEG